MMSRVLRELDPELDASAIRVEEGSIEAVMRLKSEIDAGRWIALLGDRAELSDSRRVVRVPFLGSLAPFPHGFLHMAAVLGCPVYFIACLRTGPDAYEVVVELLAERIDVGRRTRDADLARWTALYAARLEECCLRAPLQWFNFYDFWAPRPASGEELHAHPN
jgi:predicted LPLAT superfamily acyltransferase